MGVVILVVKLDILLAHVQHQVQQAQPALAVADQQEDVAGSVASVEGSKEVTAQLHATNVEDQTTSHATVRLRP